MALFTFTDLQPAVASSELRTALDVDADEPLLARCLYGSGRRGAARRVVEIIVPARLPKEVHLDAEGLLSQNLDFAAPHLKYGEYHEGDLRDALRASEAVVLHDWLRYEGPEYAPDPEAPDGLILTSDTEDERFSPFAVQVFFDPPRVWSELRQLIERLYGRVRRAYLSSRPGEQWWRNVGRV